VWGRNRRVLIPAPAAPRYERLRRGGLCSEAAGAVGLFGLIAHGLIAQAASARPPRFCSHMLQQSPRCSFNQVQHFLKSVSPAVIRIGHLSGIRVGCEFEKQPNAITHRGWGALVEGVKVLSVHCQYQVEAAEVLRLNHPRTQRRHVVAAAKRSLARASIRRSADVIGSCAGGVDFQYEIGRLSRRDLAKHDLCGGRAADITEADE